MIDPRAVIYDGAQIAEGVEIGPFSVIGSEVVIGEGCKISSHVVINGKTTLGKNNRIYQFASVGEEPIDRTFHGEFSQTIIGDDNIIREGVTIHGGTAKDRGITEIGSRNLIMNYVHIGHDCILGNNITLVNYCGLAGHVIINDFATIGISCGVHQFVRVGSYVFVAHGTMVLKDVPPYLMVTGGIKATPCGVNIEGLKRTGFTKEQLSNVQAAYKILYRQGLRLVEAIEKIKELRDEKDAKVLDLFIEVLSNSHRGVIR